MPDLKVDQYYSDVGGAAGWKNNTINLVMNPTNCQIGIDGDSTEIGPAICELIIQNNIQMFQRYLPYLNFNYLGTDSNADPADRNDERIVLWFDPKPDVYSPIGYTGWAAAAGVFDDGFIKTYADCTWFDHPDVQQRFMRYMNHELGHVCLSGHGNLELSMMKLALILDSEYQAVMPTITDLANFQFANNGKSYNGAPFELITDPLFIQLPDSDEKQHLYIPCVVGLDGERYTVILERQRDSIEIDGESKPVFRHVTSIRYFDPEHKVTEFRFLNQEDFTYSNEVILDDSGTVILNNVFVYSLGSYHYPVTLHNLGDGRVWAE